MELNMRFEVVTHTKQGGATTCNYTVVTSLQWFSQLLLQTQGGQQDICLHKKTRLTQLSPDE